MRFWYIEKVEFLFSSFFSIYGIYSNCIEPLDFDLFFFFTAIYLGKDIVFSVKPLKL